MNYSRSKKGDGIPVHEDAVGALEGKLNSCRGGIPQGHDGLYISLPIGESLPNKLHAKVGCLAF